MSKLFTPLFKRLSVALTLGLIAGQVASGPAFAYPKASSLTCAQMKKMINQRGSVYIFTRFGKTSQFVNNAGICTASGKRLDYFSVVTKDKSYCTLRRCSDLGIDSFHD